MTSGCGYSDNSEKGNKISNYQYFNSIVMDSHDRFLVNASLLRDSPYDQNVDKSWPNFEALNISSLANEIVNGTKTCYLVSGYRGVGKTSFIMRVREKVEELQNDKRKIRDALKAARSERIQKELKPDKPEKIPGTLFVLTNFAKYENQKSLLRRMIRDLYLTYKKMEPADAKVTIKENIKEGVERQYVRTIEKVKDAYIRIIEKIKALYFRKNKGPS